MRYISSYQPKTIQAVLALSAGLILVVSGCSSSSSSPSSDDSSTTTTTTAQASPITDGYILADMVSLPMVELPPLPQAPAKSLTDLLLPPTVEAPVTSNVEPASALESPPREMETDSYDIFKGPNYTYKVVLTFDDCPASYEQLVAVVSTAQQSNIGLVLAPTGACIDSYQQRGYNIIDVMRDHGQYVINHSVSHSAFSGLSPDAILSELAVPGVVTNFGRPPYGDGLFPSNYSQKVADVYQYANMRVWLWTVDTEDWKGKSATEVVNYAVNNSNQQDTVLMHMNHQAFNPESVLAIKNGLKARGLEVCSAYNGTTPGMLPDRLPC